MGNWVADSEGEPQGNFSVLPFLIVEAEVYSDSVSTGPSRTQSFQELMDNNPHPHPLPLPPLPKELQVNVIAERNRETNKTHNVLWKQKVVSSGCSCAHYKTRIAVSGIIYYTWINEHSSSYYF